MINISFNKPCLESEEIKNILESISSGKIAGDGKFNVLCQDEIARVIGAKKVLLTTSGTDALELCGLLYDFQPGDEEIMPSFTFVSTANAFCLRGARPVFIDILYDTLNTDENLIESAITNRTKAIVPVHYAGVACNMNTINTTASKFVTCAPKTGPSIMLLFGQ
jgi:dTDP-4-amino-4,6-dideoxygalactose transaminase